MRQASVWRLRRLGLRLSRKQQDRLRALPSCKTHASDHSADQQCLAHAFLLISRAARAPADGACAAAGGDGAHEFEERAAARASADARAVTDTLRRARGRDYTSDSGASEAVRARVLKGFRLTSMLTRSMNDFCLHREATGLPSRVLLCGQCICSPPERPHACCQAVCAAHAMQTGGNMAEWRALSDAAASARAMPGLAVELPCSRGAKGLCSCSARQFIRAGSPAGRAAAGAAADDAAADAAHDGQHAAARGVAAVHALLAPHRAAAALGRAPLLPSRHSTSSV